MDALRGTAILLVVFSHVSVKTATPYIGGILGLELSFFVSGFCLMLVYVQYMVGDKPFQGWGLYTSRRFWKIVPSYYLALIPIALWFPFEAKAGITRLHDVILHLSFLYPFNDTSYFSLNGNYWSLGVEVEFYLIFPLFVLAFVRRPWLSSAVLTAIGILYIAIVSKTTLLTSTSWFFGLLGYLPLFALGAASSYAYGRWIHAANLSRTVRVAMTVLSIAFLATFVFEMVQLTGVERQVGVWVWAMDHRVENAVLFSAFTLTTLAALPAWNAVVANPVLRFYADISYNVYLWNAPVIALIVLAWPHATLWPLLAVSTIAMTAISVVIHRYFELPLMRYGAQRARQKSEAMSR